MARDKAGLEEALKRIPEIRNEFWTNVRIPGSANGLNSELEKAGRVADFIEFAEVFAKDALHREESCGGHFREEFQSEEGEAVRRDDEFAYVAAWEFSDQDPGKAKLHKEALVFENVKLITRSYK